jgi:hypothetical protein
MSKQKEIRVATGSLWKTERRQGFRNAKKASELLNESPTISSMLIKAERLRHFGKHAEVENVYAEMGGIYLSRKLFHLAGTYFKKAKKFIDAANAFMQCKEYLSAGRCFETAKDRRRARKAYSMAGARAEKSNNLSLAHHAYKKASCDNEAQRVDEKIRKKHATLQKARQTREKARQLKLDQIYKNDALLQLLGSKSHLD